MPLIMIILSKYVADINQMNIHTQGCKTGQSWNGSNRTIMAVQFISFGASAYWKETYNILRRLLARIRNLTIARRYLSTHYSCNFVPTMSDFPPAAELRAFMDRFFNGVIFEGFLCGMCIDP